MTTNTTNTTTTIAMQFTTRPLPVWNPAGRAMHLTDLMITTSPDAPGAEVRTYDAGGAAHLTITSADELPASTPEVVVNAVAHVMSGAPGAPEGTWIVSTAVETEVEGRPIFRFDRYALDVSRVRMTVHHGTDGIDPAPVLTLLGEAHASGPTAPTLDGSGLHQMTTGTGRCATEVTWTDAATVAPPVWTPDASLIEFPSWTRGAARRDRHALDCLATLLGTSESWSSGADFLDDVARIVCSVRTEWSDPEEYAAQFLAAEGRPVVPYWDRTPEPEDDDAAA